MLDGVADDGLRFAGEGTLAGGHLVEHQAEGEDVGARVQRLAAHLLGRHVSCRAQLHAGAGEGGLLRVVPGFSPALPGLFVLKGRTFRCAIRIVLPIWRGNQSRWGLIPPLLLGRSSIGAAEAAPLLLGCPIPASVAGVGIRIAG